MLLIVEGVDCAGKTWVTHQLLKKLDRTMLIKHGTRPKTGTPEELNELKDTYTAMYGIHRDLEQDGMKLIMDRYYPSELIYSNIMRNYDASEDPYYDELENKILKIPHLLIFVTADWDVLVRRLKERGDDYIDESQLKRLLERYQDWLQTTHLRTNIIINNDLDNIDMLIDDITMGVLP